MRLQRTIAEVTQKAGETPPRKLCGKFGHCYNSDETLLFFPFLWMGYPACEVCPLSRRRDEYEDDKHRYHEARDKRGHRVQRVQVKMNVPVPLEMHQRHHGSLFAMAADPLQDKPMKSPLLLGSFSPGNCNDTDAEPITSTAGTSRWFTRNR